MVDGEERADDHVPVHAGHGAGHGAGDHRALIDAAAVAEHEGAEEKEESEETHLYACHVVPHRVCRAKCAGILSAVCQYIHVYPSDHDPRARHLEHIRVHLQRKGDKLL